MPRMRILALEASTDQASCALWLDGKVIERRCAAARPSSETMLPTVATLLADAQLDLVRLDGIAFGAGPGSFTGVRVACGVAQGLAFVHGQPLMPVSTLAAVALAAGPGRVLAVLDARMKEVYAGCFAVHDETVEPLGEETVAPPERVELPTGDDWRAAGNAAAAYPVLAERLAAAHIGLASASGPMAAQVAILGARQLAAGAAVAAEAAAPRYVRDKVAQTIAERLAQGGKA